MRAIRAALAATLLAGAPAQAQQSAQTEAMRVLRTAETGLRDTLRQMDEGSIPPALALSRLRQALNEVERAMLQLPAESRQGAPWQTAVKEVTEALATLRNESIQPEAARAEAGEALATLPALRGEETGTEGG